MSNYPTAIYRLLGKRIHRIVGFPGRNSKIDATHILFDDHETYICLIEQDEYDYHDCCHRARLIDVCRDRKEWEKINNHKKLCDATNLTD